MTFILLFISACGVKNEIPVTGMDYLDKSIEFHDPNGSWQDAEMKLTFMEIDAARADLERTVGFSLPKGNFEYYMKDEEKEIQFYLSKDSCRVLLNGSEEFSDYDKENYRLDCDRVNLMKDYYTYLYGLPMKLKDPGTIVHEDVIEEEFNGKSYNSIRVTYEEEVGADVWYFYLDKETYELKGYRFQHNLGEHDGEFITLAGLVEFKGMKIPKTRSWYVNRSGDYLATDELISIEPF